MHGIYIYVYCKTYKGITEDKNPSKHCNTIYEKKHLCIWDNAARLFSVLHVVCNETILDYFNGMHGIMCVSYVL